MERTERSEADKKRKLHLLHAVLKLEASPYTIVPYIFPLIFPLDHVILDVGDEGWHSYISIFLRSNASVDSLSRMTG